MHSLRRLFKNTVALSTASALRLGVGLILTIYIAHNLGPGFLGKYTLLVAYINIFQLLAEAGIPRLVTREVTRSHTETSRYFWNSLVVQLVCSLLAAAGMIGVVALLGYPADTTLMLFLAAGALPTYAAAAAGAAILQAYERMEFATLAEIVSSVGQLVATILVLRAGYGVVGLALVKVFGFALIAVVNLAALWRLRLVRRFQCDLRFGWRLLSQAKTILMMTACESILLRLDVLVITQFRGEVATGLYNAAYQLVKAFVLLVWAFVDAFFPVLSRLYSSRSERLGLAFGRALLYGSAAILPVAVGGTSLAAPVIQLVYGARGFVEAAPALRLLVWHLLPFFAYTLLVRALIASDRQDLAGRVAAGVLVAALVFEVGLIYVGGMIGAAVAANLTFITGVIIAWRAVARFASRPLIAPGQVGRLALAGLGLAAILVGLARLPLWLQVGAGGIVYLGLALVLGVMPVRELAAMFVPQE